jgi:glycosyltransferase involved in cell wall biosynthesis
MSITSTIESIIHSICNPKELIRDIVISNYNTIQDFDLGLVIPTHNRPEYLKYVLYTLKHSVNFPQKLVILIFDDNSNDNTCELIKRFDIADVPIIRIFTNRVNGLVSNNYGNTVLPGSIFPFSIRYGMEILFSLGAKYVMNNDSDSIFSKNWLNKTLTALETIHEPNYILAGFRCQQKYHAIKQENDVLPLLESFGGVNFTINKNMFNSHVKDFIYDYTFDWKLVEQCRNNGIPMYLMKPSIVQHIGINSVIVRFGKVNTDTHTDLDKGITDEDIEKLNEFVKTNDSFPFADDFIYYN